MLKSNDRFNIADCGRVPDRTGRLSIRVYVVVYISAVFIAVGSARHVVSRHDAAPLPLKGSLLGQ